MTLQRIAQGLLDLVLPPFEGCSLCGNPAGMSSAPCSTGICESCMRSYTPIIKHLALPSLPSHDRDDVLEHAVVVAAGVYEGRLKEAIWRLKYGGRQDLCEPLGSLMAAAGHAAVEGGAGSFDIIVPVPLHPTREAARGFNQSFLLSRVVGRHLGLPVEAGKLRRSRETLPQSTLDQRERRRNISGAFSVSKRGWFESRRVLVVDDVFTTGATAFECRAVLLDDGAESVDVLVCAITGG